MAQRKVTLQECDNPECDYEEIISKDEPATGYHFGSGKGSTGPAGFYILAGGGPIPSFYAHSEKCIVPAMNAAFERDR